jgi:hypothetical protein
MKIDLEAPPPDFIGMAWGVIDCFTEDDATLKELCAQWGISQAQFYQVCKKDKDLKDAFALARQVRAQRYADEALALCKPQEDDWQEDQWGRFTGNTGKINRDSLRVRTLLHLAAKFDPEQFGDRVINENRDDSRATLVIGDTQAAAALIKAQRQARLTKPQEQHHEQESEPGTKEQSQPSN